jgi:protein O-mannosyl-transferase
MATRHGLILILASLGISALAFWALVPGLSGGFLFDDYVNLPALGAFGKIDDAHKLGLYLTSALGDPIGRPLSLLSFLLNADNWPAQAAPFLLTNVLIHLINGLLLIAVLLRLGQEQKWTLWQVQAGALLGGALWLLHPLFLSTTLYIVQRETMLATFFVLIGFLAWIAGRRRVLGRRYIGGGALLITGSLVCTGLAALCKANGLLLPLLLLVAEGTVLGAIDRHSDVVFLRMRRALLIVPVAVLLAMLVWMLPHYADVANSQRPWSLGQRLWSEPRVLLSYLDLILLPRPISGGVFHDNFLASSDPLHPSSTIPAALLVLGLIAAAWRYRRRYCVLSFAILFFFAGQALESTVVPLELYFEHRNYLPAMPLFWPLAVWLTAPGKLDRLRYTAAALLVMGLALDTHAGAQFWGDPPRLALAWAAYNPDSPRAQAFAAQHEMAMGHFAQARNRLMKGLTVNPDEAQLALNLADAECGLGGSLEPSTIQIMQRALTASANAALLDYTWLAGAVPRAQSQACTGLDLPTLRSLLAAARANPHFVDAPGREQDFDHVQGLLSIAGGNPEQALIDFDAGIGQWPRPEVALQQAALLGSAGRPDLGLRHLDTYATYPSSPNHVEFSTAGLHAWLLDRTNYWQHELLHLRDALAQDQQRLQNAGLRGGSPPA